MSENQARCLSLADSRRLKYARARMPLTSAGGLARTAGARSKLQWVRSVVLRSGGLHGSAGGAFGGPRSFFNLRRGTAARALDWNSRPKAAAVPRAARAEGAVCAPSDAPLGPWGLGSGARLA